MSAHEALNSETHRDLRVRTERGADLGDATMSCVTVPAEFRKVQNEYPILFRLNVERDDFLALALFGFEHGENLFLDGDRWDARYRPLAMEIQPFLIGQGADMDREKQVHVDTASKRIGRGEGTRVFDEDGRPTPYLEAIAEQLGELDEGYQATSDFFAALRRHELLEPMSLEITLDDGSKNRLVGFHVIDEDRLRSLDEAALGELHESGHLMPIFMAIASLSNLTTLIARKNAKVARG